MKYATLTQKIGYMKDRICDYARDMYGSIKPKEVAVVPVKNNQPRTSGMKKAGILSLIALYIGLNFSACSKEANPMISTDKPKPKPKSSISLSKILKDGKDAIARVFAEKDGFARYTIKRPGGTLVRSDSGYVTGGDTTRFTETGLAPGDYEWEVKSQNSQSRIFAITEGSQPSAVQDSLPNTNEGTDSADVPITPPDTSGTPDDTIPIPITPPDTLPDTEPDPGQDDDY